MIKKLRQRFIILSLAVVAAVILVIVVGIDVANYLNMQSKADAEIAFIEQGGAIAALPSGDSDEPQEDKFDRAPKGIPGETAFAARYFIVETDAEGNVWFSNLQRIARVDEDDLAYYVSRAKFSRGFVGNYRYRAVHTATGSRYVFLDCEKEIAATTTFIVSSAIITVVGLSVIALLIILLSRKVLAPVEESYRKQKRFITDAGHELKTPITVIGANAELLEMEIGEDNEWLESIKHQTQKLSSLTQELVYLSRMDESDAEVARAAFDLEQTVQSCVEEFRDAALVAEKDFVLDLTPLSVNANEEMVCRAVNLMLDNALKYAESESIRVSLRREGKFAVLEESNASSLPHGKHPELFERFYRADASRGGSEGYGIGLSVVRSIAEHNGGAVSCESDGATVVFRLTLPLA